MTTKQRLERIVRLRQSLARLSRVRPDPFGRTWDMHMAVQRTMFPAGIVVPAGAYRTAESSVGV